MKTNRKKILLCELEDLLFSINDTLSSMRYVVNSIDEEVNTSHEEETDSGPTQTSQRQYECETLHQMMKHHLDSVKESTGEVTIEDYEYCNNLTRRILAHQSSKKVD
jgi:hypothetical protein